MSRQFRIMCQNAPPFRAGMNGILLNPPPLMGGDIGEGETFGLFTPTLILPHQGGGDPIEAKRKMPLAL